MAVGSLPANAWGLHEMHGNVWEWCQDAYAPYPAGGTEAPALVQPRWWHMLVSPPRVLRGGCWSISADFCRAAYRHWGEPGFRSNGVGLRLARTLPE